MTDARIVVTGDIPRFPQDGPGGSPCDAVELVASRIGVSWDDVTHLRHASPEDVQRLQNMTHYVAGVALDHAEMLLSSATELVVFDIPHLRLRRQRHARQIEAVLTAARNLGVSHQYFGDISQFKQTYLNTASRTN